MRAVILAAGRGARLGDEGAQRPKCLTELAGRPLLDHQLAVYRRLGVEPVVVTGYRAGDLVSRGVAHRHNPRYATTNMVASLACARDVFDGGDDVVVSYGDIVFEERVLAALAGARGELAIAVDLDWRALWELRMDDPLADAETLRRDGARLIEIGRRPTSYAEIEAQYMGLLRFDRAVHARWFAHLDRRSADPAFARISMTELLQEWIAAGNAIETVAVRGGWLEVDTLEDLQRYRAALADGTLARRFRPASAEPGGPR